MTLEIDDDEEEEEEKDDDEEKEGGGGQREMLFTSKPQNQAFNSLKLNKNISTTVHAMTKSFVPFCSAQNGESTDINCLMF